MSLIIILFSKERVHEFFVIVKNFFVYIVYHMVRSIKPDNEKFHFNKPWFLVKLIF